MSEDGVEKPSNGTPGVPLRCIVTGGAGFVGSHLVDHLLAAGARVTVVDDFSTGRRENLPDAHASLRVVESDVAAALRAFGPGERFDRIYHLAAAVGVLRVVRRPIESIENNVGETASVFRFALEHGPAEGTPARVLFTSSSEVYGKAAKVPFEEEDDCVYGATTARRWSYAASKALGEHLALAHHEQHGLPVVVVRLFNTVGPRQVGDYGMVLPRFVRAALEGQPSPVHGDGSQTRCFCDVRDVVPALIRLLETPACDGRVFNLGSDRVISIADLARQVNETLGSTAGILAIPYHDAFGPGFEDLQHRRPSLDRVREAIGFHPSHDLPQTIRDIADHVRTSGDVPRAHGR
ncbi:MAG: NAD-dependent epimerase/dehydratase family protein [Planctomycetota bacterium]